MSFWDIKKHEWKTIAGYPLYEVSDCGRIRNRETGKMLKPFIDKSQDYQRVSLCKDGTKKKFLIHRIVAESFIGPRPIGYEIDHINSNRFDNRLSNLKYVSPEENRNNPFTLFKVEIGKIRRAIRHGRKTRNEIMALVNILRENG